MPQVLEQLLAATKVSEVVDVITTIAEERRISWRPVGDNENNLATINLGRDPAAGLVERITNAIDAILEREWNERGQPTQLPSPRSAVRQWFGIPDGRLGNVRDLRDESVSSLTSRVSVSLLDSERQDRPTVDIRDYGIGIPAGDFATSILSLHGSRKLRKLFLAGAFGQGGSTALSYSPFTIIVSRAASTDQTIAATIVRFNSGDPSVDKHGLYEYMVDHSTGHPLIVDTTDVDFEVGTLVRQVSMDLGKYKNILTAQTGSLWYLAHHYLFDPVLPFWIEEQRSNASQGQGRTVAGNHRLLSLGENTEYQRSALRTFRSGTIRLNWWVLSPEGDGARNRITQYTLPSQPIVVTYNGQKQGELPNTVIKKDLRLPYLERYLIVHVDCDDLDNESRRQLFPTTRESLRDTSIMDELRVLVQDTLAGDSELARLDRERKQRYLRRVDNESVDNIRRRLASRVRTVIQAGGPGTSPRVNPPDSPTSPAPRPLIPVQEPPTFLEITSPHPRRVYAGKRFTLAFKTDADPAYFLNPDSFVAVITPPEFGQYTGTTNVRGGYGTAYFKVAEGIPDGTTATVTLEVRPRRAASLRGQTDLVVEPLPPEAGPGTGQAQTPNINPQWVAEGDAFWQEREWTAAHVAEVVQSEQSIDIFVSADNRRLSALIARAQRRDTDAVDAIKDFYLEHISFHALLADLEEQRRRAENPQTEQPAPMEDQSLEADHELRRTCETICGIIDAMFDFVSSRTGTADSQGIAEAVDSPSADAE